MNDNDQILDWLKESPLAIPLRSGKGFYVMRGKALLFPDHTTMEVLDFIQCLGIWDGDLWGDYRVKYTEPGGPYAEKLTFFYEQNAYPVPFARPIAAVTSPPPSDGFDDPLHF
jgi:hypothetical protein